MAFVEARDGTQIYYKEWGSGQPVVLSHGWPLNGDSWEAAQRRQLGGAAAVPGGARLPRDRA